jgi:DNA-3-methyladenine glycosylase
LIYGNYYQLNITTFKEGYPECVLIRSLEPIRRINADTMRMNADLHADLRGYYYQRYNPCISAVNPKGPGKVCEYLKLDKSFWGEDLCNSKRIWLEYGERIKDNKIVRAKRIGIDYAEEYKNKLWRFYIKNNKWVSKK